METIAMAGIFGLMISCAFGIADIAWLCLAITAAACLVMFWKGN